MQVVFVSVCDVWYVLPEVTAVFDFNCLSPHIVLASLLLTLLNTSVLFLTGSDEVLPPEALVVCVTHSHV